MAKATTATIAAVCGLMLSAGWNGADASGRGRTGPKQVSATRTVQAAPARPARLAAADHGLRRASRFSGAKASSRPRAVPEAVELASLPAAGGATVDHSFGGGLSCVPYVRMVTGIQVTGNGGTWWNNAAGLYQRGSRPEVGSVLAFRSSGGMRLGHVAVVERLVGPREILIHHSNWAGPGIRRGTVTRGVSVVDVSEGNDWTAVRVQVGVAGGTYGRTYPTYGFIHNRPEGGRVMMVRGRSLQEVAEAPSAHLRFINTAVGGLGIESAR